MLTNMVLRLVIVLRQIKMVISMNHNKSDIFVSYARADNEPLAGADKGWVTTLIKGLKNYLRPKLARADYSLWLDQELRGNELVTPDIAKQVENSTLFVLILSQAYIASSWCRKELNTFLAKAGKDTKRVVVVEREKVQRPDELSDLQVHQFWLKEDADHLRILGMPKPNPEEDLYYKKLDDLARQLSDKLKTLNDLAESRITPTPSQPLKTRSDKVFTHIKNLYGKALKYQELDDPEPTLMSARKVAEAICKQIFIQKFQRNPGQMLLEDMLQKLEAKNLLPEHINILRTIQSYGNFGVHDQGEDAEPITMADIQPCVSALDTLVNWFKEYYYSATNKPAQTIFLANVTADLEARRDDVKRYLDQHNIQVLPNKAYTNNIQQLNDDLSQCCLFVQLLSDKMGNGYSRIQYERAKAANLPIIQWRNQDLILSTVQNYDHRDLLESSTVMATEFIDFQEAILKQLQSPVLEKPEERVRFSVFINAAPEDMALARQIGEIFKRQGIGYQFPRESTVTTTATEIQQYLQHNLKSCDAVMVIYDKTSKNWVEEQVRFCRYMLALREQPFKIMAVCDKPSTDKSPIQMPNLQVLKCPTLLTDNGLLLFIKTLKT